MKKEITIREFVAELLCRIEGAKDINCCKEVKVFAEHVVRKIGDDKIVVDWKDGH
jgi:hypothetical protein